MKKFFIFSFIIILIMLTVPSVSAADSLRAPVDVEIITGGTAVIITEVNCPVPENSKLELENGEVGAFYIDFTDEGTYSYLIMEMPDERNIKFDTTVYKLTFTVNEIDGELNYSVIAYRNEKKYSSYLTDGYERLLFTNVEELPPDSTENTESAETSEKAEGTQSSESKNNAENTENIKKISPAKEKTKNIASNTVTQPQTGDDTMMEFYFLLAILASAGLFVLSIIYTINTNRYIKEKKEKKSAEANSEEHND